MAKTFDGDRRDFLKNIALAGGGLLLGFSWDSARAGMPSLIGASSLPADTGMNGYLSILADGTVHIHSPNPELGQNIMTSFAQIVAEELDADWTKVKVSQAPLDTKRFERQLTGGSGAIPHSWMRLRKAGASARHLLIAAAAKRWGVPASECRTDNGTVVHAASGRKAGYGELAAEASALEMPADVKLKDRKDFRIIGKPVRNVANRDIVTGKGIYGIDVYKDGMAYAVIQRPPAFGTKIKNVDAAAAKAMPGVSDVVVFKNNVAVVGRSTWEVMKARKTLKVEYEKDGAIESTEDHDRIFTEMLNGSKSVVRRKDGDVEAAFRQASRVVKAEYQCPFLAHNPLEPMNFYADVRTDKVELVGPTQTPAAARSQVSRLLGMPEDRISLQITRLGGGFGRRLRNDYALEAAELSSLIKNPVKVVWSREDDMTGGVYRPAVRYRFEAALDATGNLTGYRLRGVGINADNSTREDNFPSGAVPNLLIDSVDHKSPITTGAWRAPITNFLAYAEQSFLDEVAAAAGKDPVTFRLDLLKRARTSPTGAVKYNIDRMEGVIRKAAEMSKWGSPRKGVSQGFSVYFSHASYVAQVAEVTMKDGRPEVERVFAAVDCGPVINLSGARQQAMGAIVDGLGHAMYSRITFKDGIPQQSNFNQYRLIRMKEIPEVEVQFLETDYDPTGLGEPALPPTGGAVANAVFKATGKRLYRQPFMEEAPFKRS
jgi:isoquinoline 1-oxidoreductase beta subunit